MVVPITPVIMNRKLKLNSTCGTKVAHKIVDHGWETIKTVAIYESKESVSHLRIRA